MNKELKVYRSNKEGKEGFVNGPLSNLIYQANTGWGGCKYHVDENNEEYVILLTLLGEEAHAICVSADSCEAIVRDVFRYL